MSFSLHSRSGSTKSKTLNGPSHDEWLRQKEREKDDLAHLKMLKKKKEKALKQKKKSDVEKSFNSWVKKKSRYEKIVDLLSKMKIARAQEDKPWREVGISLAACDCLLGTYDLSDADDDIPSLGPKMAPVPKGKNVPASQRPLPTLAKKWVGWSKGRAGDPRHQYADVIIPKDEGKKLSPQVQENAEVYAQSYKESLKYKRGEGSQQGSDVDDDEQDDSESFWKVSKDEDMDDDEIEFVLPALGFTPPLGRAPRNKMEEILETSTGLLNTIWNRRTKLIWKKCQQQVILRVKKRLAKFEADREEDSDPDDGGMDEEELKRNKLESILLSMSIGSMSKWIEKDLIADEDLKREKEDEDRQNGINLHAGWLRNKNRNMIRLPPPTDEQLAAAKKVVAPRMNFGGRSVARKKKINVMTNSVDMMLSSGLRTIHANPKSKSDLRNARKALLKMGYVNKANFVAQNHDNLEDGQVDEDDFRTQLLENPAVQRVKELNAEKDKRNDGKDYDDWQLQKEQVARAKKCLSMIDRPYEGESKESDEEQREDYWKKVGKNLKRVDVTLMPQYAIWSEGYKTFGECKTAWEKNYPPFDVFNHPDAAEKLSRKEFADLQNKQVAMELTKDTLLKIIKNRRDYNWDDPFNDTIDSKIDRLGERYDQYRVLKKLDESVFKKVQKKAYSYNDLNKILRKEGARLSEDDAHTLFMELKLKRYKKRRAMTPSELQKFFSDEGIALTGPEIKSLYAAFDANNDNELSSTEFMTFAKQARTAQLNPNSDFWSTLPTLQTYLEKLNEKSVDKQKLRKQGVRALEKLAHANLEAEKEQKMLEKGQPPASPLLTMDRSMEKTKRKRSKKGNDGTTSLTLNWMPGESDALPIFYVLEVADKSGKIFEEVCKDPPSAFNNGQPVFPEGVKIVDNLTPNTNYLFRITAFNGFGPSTPTYANFTTLPIAPPQPRVMKTSVTVDKCAVTLSWGEGEEYMKKIKQLRKIFDILDDEPQDGTLSRKEFKDFESEIHKNPNLAEFLAWSGCDKNKLFDFNTYDDDDDGIMTFEEFAKVLLSLVQINANKPRVQKDGDLETKTTDSGAAVASGTKFLLLQCVADDAEQMYTPVTAPTHKTEWIVSGLIPGQSYQFAVQALNQDNEAGPQSKPCIVNALYYEPEVPKAIVTKSGAVKIGWKAAPVLDISSMLLGDVGGSTPSNSKRLGNSQSKNKLRNSDSGALRASKEKLYNKNPLAASAQFNKGVQGTQSGTWMKKLADWTNPKSEGSDYAESGVSQSSVARIFNRYDRPSEETGEPDGTLDATELKTFLKDLGMPADSAAVESVLQDMDEDGNGIISLTEFTKWWKKHDVTYVLKWDNGTPESLLSASGGRVPGRPNFVNADYFKQDQNGKDITSCYFKINDGSDKGVKSRKNLNISEFLLEPNTMYRFAIRYRTRRSFSPLSRELQICTPPGQPTQPAVVSVRAREVTLKWYPGLGGAAFKYVVLYKKLAKINSSGKLDTKLLDTSSNDGWDKCYEGSNTLARITTGLDAETAYAFKVAALNRQYARGEASIPVQIVTKRSREDINTTPDNVEEIFTIECTGDVVTGDTIVFTERVYGIVSKNAMAMQKENRKQKALMSRNKSKGSHWRPPSVNNSKLSVESSGSIRLSQSIDGGSGKKEFITERTIAAVVFKESDGDDKRTLTMQVVWCVTSKNTDVAKSKMVKAGAIISRAENHLREFEVLRCQWAQENARWTSSEEKTARAMDNGLLEDDMEML